MWVILFALATPILFFTSPSVLASSPDSVLLEGDWQLGDGGCWVVVDSGGEEWGVKPEIGLDVYPKNGWQTSMTGRFEQGGTDSCGNPLFIIEMIHEQNPPQITGKNQAEFPVYGWLAILTPLFIIIAFIVVITTDEGAAYETGKLAGKIVVGKGSRTVEASFLRGRIVGFLSMNEGLHFSAIAAHFGLGNHQAAHHLSVLEGEGHLWRKRDGRLLRFYTGAIATSDGGGLPTPLEIPPADSLAVRLLSLINTLPDISSRHQQKHLASYLSTSQQLISHHLKTMEGAGWLTRSGGRRKPRIHLTSEGIEVMGLATNMGGVAFDVEENGDSEVIVTR